MMDDLEMTTKKEKRSRDEDEDEDENENEKEDTTKNFKTTGEGVQIVFKSKKKEIRNLKDHIEEQLENQKSNKTVTDGSNFRKILDESIKKEKNPYLFETFEYVINGRKVEHEDVIYI